VRGLIDGGPIWIFALAASLSMIIGGAVCVSCGTRWNWHGVEHSFYFIPLHVWGWLYFSSVGLFAVATIAGAIKQGLDKPRWLYQGIAGVVGLVVVIALGVVLRRLARPVSDTPDGEGKFDHTQNPGDPLDGCEAEQERAESSLGRNMRRPEPGHLGSVSLIIWRPCRSARSRRAGLFGDRRASGWRFAAVTS
jgi:hypothetical protein